MLFVLGRCSNNILKLILIFKNENEKLLEVANLNRPPPVKMFLEEQDYQHNLEFNYMRLQRLD